MGFLGLGKPQWKHRDAEVRLRAIAGLAEGSQGTFQTIASDDTDPRVRAAAASRIREVPRLIELQRHSDPAVQRIAGERLSGVADQWLRIKPLAECQAFLVHVTDQKTLAELSVQAKDAGVRAAAFARFIAQPEPSVALFSLVAIQDAAGNLGVQAVARIDKRGMLKDIARKAKSEPVRAAAAARAAELDAAAERPSPEQLRQVRRKALPPLLEQAMRLAVSTDWERSAAAWTPLIAQWDAARDTIDLDAETTALEQRFQRARSDFASRRAAAAALVQAEAERLSQAQAARESFLAALAQREPATAEQAEALQREVTQGWAALGELPADRLRPLAERLAVELARLCPAAKPLVAADAPVAPREVAPEVIARLTAIATEAEGLTGREAKFRFQELHKEWSKLALDLTPADPLAQRFNLAWNTWKTRGRELRENRQGQTEERLAAMKALVVEAESLTAEADAFGGAPEPTAVEPFAAKLKDLQARWKAIGPVRFEQSQPLREQFRAAIDHAYVPVNATRDAADWERFANLTRAEELIVRTQALAENQDLGQVIAAVKQAHQEWKAVGPLPRDKGQDAWLRFKALCDAQFERAKPWFAEQDALRQQNLERKQALFTELQGLCTQSPVGLAGSPADIQARRSAHERIKAIQAEWKDIGQVPREHDGELWRSYRAVLDAYYAQQREQMSARNAEQGENLTRKLGLIVAVEELATLAEGQQRPTPSVLAEIKRLQQVWKTVGHVPKDQADAIWEKWRTACDRVYASLKEHLAGLDAERRENQAKKEALITEVEELANHENAHWFKDDVREIQGKWRLIGYVPREVMDSLNERFHAACDRVLHGERSAAGSSGSAGA
jgi:hypothetical protein